MWRRLITVMIIQVLLSKMEPLTLADILQPNETSIRSADHPALLLAVSQKDYLLTLGVSPFSVLRLVLAEYNMHHHQGNSPPPVWTGDLKVCTHEMH